MSGSPDLIRECAQAMVDWGVMLAQDYFESILEEIIPTDTPDAEFWKIAWEAHALATDAEIPAPEADPPASEAPAALPCCDRHALDPENPEPCAIWLNADTPDGCEVNVE